MIYSSMLSNTVHMDLFHKCWALFLHLNVNFSVCMKINLAT